MVISLDDEILMLFSNQDYDPLSKDKMEASVARVVSELEKPLEQVRRQQDPKVNLIGAGKSLAGLLVFVLAICLLRRLRRWCEPKIEQLEKTLDAKLRALGFSSITVQLDVFGLLGRIVHALLLTLCAYAFAVYALHQFPYPEPWSDALGGYIFAIVGSLSAKAVKALPGLFVVLVIFILTSWIARVVRSFFRGISSGNIVVNWLDPEAALPTAKIVGGIIWIFGVVMAYPYIPGSSTDAFKGIGIFLGLLISLAASSMVGQVIGGMVLMYSRAMKVGDVVQVAEYYGRVQEIGFFSTKLRTLKNEEVNIPNSVLMGATTLNFTRLAKAEGLIAHSTVKIGYAVPWRQGHAMLINAARATAGLQRHPPAVRLAEGPPGLRRRIRDQRLRRTEGLMRVRSELHANIQDEFNRHGVQIMAPNYEDQPENKLWVPEEKRVTPPAPPDGK